MEVILTKDVDAVGGKNEVVKVKDGFARNYLFPLRMAIPATAGNLKSLKDKIRIANDLRTKRIDEAKELAEKLNKLHLTVVRKAGKEGKLFGSVTAQEVVDRIKEKSGIELDKRRIHIPAHLKTTGIYTLPCRLEVGVTAVIHLDVRSDEPVKAEEAEGQAAGEEAAAQAAEGEQAQAPAAAEGEAGSDEAPKKARKRTEAEPPAPQAAEADEAEPKKRKKKKNVNEAEMALPE